MQTVFISPEQQQILAAIFPAMRWQELDFVQPLPWFMRDNFVLAMALPLGWRSRRLRVYIKNDTQDEPRFLALLAHECYHIFQYQQLSSFWEWGWFRKFMIYYLGWYLQLWLANLWKYRFDFQRAGYESYRFHPFEIPAYDLEAQFELWQRKPSEQGFNQLIRSGLATEKAPAFWACVLGAVAAFFIAIIEPILGLVFSYFIKK